MPVISIVVGEAVPLSTVVGEAVVGVAVGAAVGEVGAAVGAAVGFVGTAVGAAVGADVQEEVALMIRFVGPNPVPVAGTATNTPPS